MHKLSTGNRARREENFVARNSANTTYIFNDSSGVVATHNYTHTLRSPVVESVVGSQHLLMYSVTAGAFRQKNNSTNNTWLAFSLDDHLQRQMRPLFRFDGFTAVFRPRRRAAQGEHPVRVVILRNRDSRFAISSDSRMIYCRRFNIDHGDVQDSNLIRGNAEVVINGVLVLILSIGERFAYLCYLLKWLYIWTANLQFHGVDSEVWKKFIFINVNSKCT